MESKSATAPAQGAREPAGGRSRQGRMGWVRRRDHPAGGTSAVLAGGLALAARYPASLPIRVKKRENCG